MHLCYLWLHDEQTYAASLNTVDDATGHLSHRMDDNHHMNDEGHGGTQRDNQTHLVSIGAADGVHVEATSHSNGVKGMFGVFSVLKQYSVCSTFFITSLVFSMCSGKERRHG